MEKSTSISKLFNSQDPALINAATKEYPRALYFPRSTVIKKDGYLLLKRPTNRKRNLRVPFEVLFNSDKVMGRNGDTVPLQGLKGITIILDKGVLGVRVGFSYEEGEAFHG